METEEQNDINIVQNPPDAQPNINLPSDHGSDDVESTQLNQSVAISVDTDVSDEENLLDNQCYFYNEDPMDCSDNEAADDQNEADDEIDVSTKSSNDTSAVSNYFAPAMFQHEQSER